MRMTSNNFRCFLKWNVEEISYLKRGTASNPEFTLQFSNRTPSVFNGLTRQSTLFQFKKCVAGKLDQYYIAWCKNLRHFCLAFSNTAFYVTLVSAVCSGATNWWVFVWAFSVDMFAINGHGVISCKGFKNI